MKVVLQRVKQAEVTVESGVVGAISTGYLLLVGFEREDTEKLLRPMTEKIQRLKLFPDEQGRFALSLEEIEGEVLIISQFTLPADLKKGRKPNFSKSLEPGKAEYLYDRFIELFKSAGFKTESGVFGEMMQVSLQNDGPVTIILDSEVVIPSVHFGNKN